MIDQTELIKLIEEQITGKVHAEIGLLLADNDWSEIVEGYIVRFAQDRINAKFSNAEYAPQLITAVEQAVKQLFHDGKIMDFKQLIDPDIITELLDKKISPILQEYVAEKFNDSSWTHKVQSISNQLATAKLERTLADSDIEAVIDNIIVRKLTERQQGIKDNATKTQITINDDYIVYENELITNQLHVIKDAKFDQSLIINDLIVKGSVNVDNRSWNELRDNITDNVVKSVGDKVVNKVLERAIKQGIEFESILINGAPLVSGNELSSKITSSNLQSIGHLKELIVNGDAQINDTLCVVNKRIGVNTDQPSMALDIWDNEVEILIGKSAKHTGFIGLGRKGDLSLGTNKRSDIKIDEDGVTTISQLKVGRNNLSFAAELPNYAGQKGDIVFNNNVSDSTFAWQCLGQFKWRVLKGIP